LQKYLNSWHESKEHELFSEAWDKCGGIAETKPPSYQLGRLLFSSSRSKIWKLKNSQMVVKQCEYETGLREVAWLKYLEGNFVVPCVDFYRKDDYLFYVMPRGVPIEETQTTMLEVIELMIEVLNVRQYHLNKSNPIVYKVHTFKGSNSPRYC
jgi:hypothetical protein